ncbi:MAG: hypothetical protein ACOYT4_00050 [Nanoarchaeota archaeon]
MVFPQGFIIVKRKISGIFFVACNNFYPMLILVSYQKSSSLQNCFEIYLGKEYGEKNLELYNMQLIEETIANQEVNLSDLRIPVDYYKNSEARIESISIPEEKILDAVYFGTLSQIPKKLKDFSEITDIVL